MRREENGRKRFAAVDSNVLSLSVVATIASILDRDCVVRLRAALRPASMIGLAWADGGNNARQAD